VACFDAAVEQAVLRGDVDQLKFLLEHVGNYSREQSRRLIQQCRINAKKIKEGTLDTRDADRRLAEALSRGEEIAKGRPQPKGPSGTIAEVVRALLQIFKD